MTTKGAAPAVATDLAGRIWRDAGAHPSTDRQVWAGLSTLASMRQNRWGQ